MPGIRLWTSVALTAALALTLMACSTDEPEPPAASASVALDDVEAAESDEIDEIAAAAEAQAAEAADPLACLHGTWLADNEFFLAGLREFGDEPSGVTGEVTMTFDPDSTVTTVYDGWEIVMVVEGMAATITREGTDRGTYTATESEVSITETDVTSVLVLEAPGMSMPVDAEPVFADAAGYTCTESEATITTPDGTARMTRR